MRAGTAPDIDDPLLRHPAPPRFGQAGDDEARALVDARIGHHQLGVGESDRAIVRSRLDDLLRGFRCMNPCRRRLRRHFGEARPDLAGFALPFVQRLAIGRAPGILVERIDVDRRRQAIDLAIAGLRALAEVAQRVLVRDAGLCRDRRALARGAQRFAAGHRRDPDLAARDPVRRLVQQQDRAVAIGADRFIDDPRLRSDAVRHLLRQRIVLAEADLLNHGDRIHVAQPAAPRVLVGLFQRGDHQAERILARHRISGSVIDLPDANDDRDILRVRCHLSAPSTPARASRRTPWALRANPRW